MKTFCVYQHIPHCWGCLPLPVSAAFDPSCRDSLTVTNIQPAAGKRQTSDRFESVVLTIVSVGFVPASHHYLVYVMKSILIT